MWRLLRGSLGHWWWRPIATAGLVAVLVGAWEAFQQGRVVGEWRAVYPWMLGVGASTAFFFFSSECRAKRYVLFKILPHTTLQVAVVKVLGPSLLVLLATLTTLALALVVGSFEALPLAGVGLLAWGGLLFFFLNFEILWAELRLRLLKSRWGRIAYYGLPGIVGAVGGARLSFLIFEDGASSFDKALLFTAFDARTLWASLVAGLVFGVLAAVLFVRRESYV